MSRQALQAEVNSLKWFHSIDFGNGLVSPGAKSQTVLQAEADRFFGSIDLSGRSLIDIGAWNGYFSFDAKRRGAAKVLATDKFVWNDPYVGRQGFNLARSHLGLDIQDMEIDLPELSTDRVGVFDVVLFAGVFYHLLDAPRLLRQVSKLAGHLMIVETRQDLLEETRPAMVYYPGSTLNNDRTNFWGPNPALIGELLAESAFEKVYNGSQWDRAIFLAFRDADSAAALNFRPTASKWTELTSEAIAQLARAALAPPNRNIRNAINFLLKRPMR